MNEIETARLRMIEEVATRPGYIPPTNRGNELVDIMAELMAGGPTPEIISLPKKWRTRKGIRRFLRTKAVQRWAERVIETRSFGNYINDKLRANSFMMALINPPVNGWTKVRRCLICESTSVDPKYRLCHSCNSLGQSITWYLCNDCHYGCAHNGKIDHQLTHHGPKHP